MVTKLRVAEWMPGEGWSHLSIPVSVEEVRETENGEVDTSSDQQKP